MNHLRHSNPVRSASHVASHAASRMASRTPRRAFTVLELLVVAGILVILLGIAVAVITSVAYSSERSLAENQLRVGMTAARDAAIRSKSGDAAAVFYFKEGRTLIQPCIKVGVLPKDDIEGRARGWSNAPSSDPAVSYEIFVPVPEVEPIVMPRNWTIRGYAPAGSLHATTTGTNYRENGWYEWISKADNALADVGLWVFPETDVLPRDQQGLLDTATNGGSMEDLGWRRQTFCVRFQAQTGETVFNDAKPFLVLDAQEAPYRFDTASPFSLFDIEQQEEPAMAVTRALASGGAQRLGNITGLAPDVAMQTVLGNRSTDMVLTRPILTVALTDERRLAAAIGLRGLNRDTASMYRRIPPNAPPADLPIDDTLAPTGFGSSTSVESEMMTRIAQYITAAPDTWGEQISLEARVYTMSRYAGQLQEVETGEEEEGQPSSALLARVK